MKSETAAIISNPQLMASLQRSQAEIKRLVAEDNAAELRRSILPSVM